MAISQTMLAGTDAAGDGEPPARRRLQFYVLTVVLLPVLFLASSIPVVRSDAFPAQSADPFLIHSDYPFSLRHVDCEVVIFGDSTASTGIDPTLIEKNTGLKSCNIAQTQSILEILGPYALDSYLRNNAPPKFIVMQFSPEFLSRRGEFFWPEGLTLLFRKKSLLAALPVLAQHPVQFYDFAMWAIKAKLRALREPPPDLASEAIFRAKGGLITLPKPPETHCVLHWSYARPSESWVQRMKQAYSSNGTRVVIDVSPVPECTQDVRSIADGFKDVTDNALPIFPIGLFCDLDRHLTLQGAEKSSEQIGAQIIGLERSSAQKIGAQNAGLEQPSAQKIGAQIAGLERPSEQLGAQIASLQRP